MKKNMKWYEKLGYKENPLAIRPGKGSLVGYEKLINRITYQVKIGNVIFLEGSFGTGKSSLLQHVARGFPRNKTLYLNYAKCDRLKNAIMSKRGWFRKLFGLKPKGLYVFIDEVNLADSRDFDFLYEFYIMDRVKSLVFAGTDFTTAPFNKAFKSDTKLYKLNDIQQKLAIDILETRMPEQRLLSAPLARKIFNHAHKNPRHYLELLEDIFRLTIESGNKRVTPKLVDTWLKK